MTDSTKHFMRRKQRCQNDYYKAFKVASTTGVWRSRLARHSDKVQVVSSNLTTPTEKMVKLAIQPPRKCFL